jgi:hypothetical protein
MDLIRSTGRTLMVLRQGDAPQLVQWAYCLPGSTVFGGIHPYGSSAWDYRRGDPSIQYGPLGEVPGAPWAGTPHYYPGLPVGRQVDGDPSWFSPSGPPSDAPPLTLAPWGVPLTCALPVPQIGVRVAVDIDHGRAYTTRTALGVGCSSCLLGPAGVGAVVLASAALPASAFTVAATGARMALTLAEKQAIYASADIFCPFLTLAADRHAVVALARLIWVILLQARVELSLARIPELVAAVLARAGILMDSESTGRTVAVVEALAHESAAVGLGSVTQTDAGPHLGVTIASGAMATPSGGCGSLPVRLQGAFSSGTGGAAALDGWSVLLIWQPGPQLWEGSGTVPGETQTTQLVLVCGGGVWRAQLGGAWQGGGTLGGSSGPQPDLVGNMTVSGPSGSGTVTLTVTGA